MKTQLLEDIGHSAEISLTSSKTVGNSTADKAVQNLAPAGQALPARPRSALGVWRQKPADEPLISITQQPDQQPTPLELHTLFEEIAALEAQFVPPLRQHEPAIAPAEPRHELPTPPSEPLTPALAPAEATLPNQTQDATAPHDPLFDFTMPLPAEQAADPFVHVAPTRSRQRYLLWAACLLAGGLLIQGGRWLYQERNDAESLALIANEAKEKLQAENGVNLPALAAKEFTAGLGDDLRVPAPVPAILPSPAAPPLVMLDPEPSDATEVEQSAPLVASPAEQPTAVKPEPVAKQGSASPSPKRPSRLARRQSDAATKPSMERGRRDPVRQIARASAIGTETPTGRDTTLAATLRACRERGYHTTQCIKRGCSVTEYGFVCRGR
ncbi:hypothetical protein ACHAC9_07830 [Massilia sp. CMS3.1]|uniref:hypothetical protein n=1 Tax=Massilia sp. CMS3.1 TaxID=3373083 RepID=UPI003EE6C680